jgi:cytochrome c oxidase subunit 1
MFTMHGTIMIFLWVVPAGTGAFANYLIPLMIGAKDMAFPKLNAVAFWMNAVGGVLLLTSFFVGPAEAGWTSYPPLSTIASKAGEAIWIFSILVAGTSSILGGLNIWRHHLKDAGAGNGTQSDAFVLLVDAGNDSPSAACDTSAGSGSDSACL